MALTGGTEPTPNFQLALNLVCSCFPDAASVQGRQLLAGLEKVNSDLDKQEKAITANLRPPLEQSRAVQDSTERSKDLKAGAVELRDGALQGLCSQRISSVVLNNQGCLKCSLSPGNGGWSDAHSFLQ